MNQASSAELAATESRPDAAWFVVFEPLIDFLEKTTAEARSGYLYVNTSGSGFGGPES